MGEAHLLYFSASPVPEILPLVVHSFGPFVVLIPNSWGGNEGTASPDRPACVSLFRSPPPVEL